SNFAARGARAGVALLAALAGLALALARADEPRATPDEKKPAPAAEKGRLPLPLPGGAVLAVCEGMADALGMMPKGYFVAPEQYNALLDELARLRQQLERRKPVVPSTCLLKGKVEGNLVYLRAQFEFVTQRPNSVVTLGCGQGLANGASLDGRVAALRGPAGARPADPEPEGFSVEVESPGTHQFSLDLVLALARPAGGTGPGFPLALPRVAVTRLDLELPPGTRDIRVGNRPLADSPFLRLRDNRLTGTLGAADRLALSFKGGARDA